MIKHCNGKFKAGLDLDYVVVLDVRTEVILILQFDLTKLVNIDCESLWG